MKNENSKKSIFGKRLREARVNFGIPQDKLGVLIGIDESCSSARISRYEAGVHAPPMTIAKNLANALDVPLTYFYCEDDWLANFLIQYNKLSLSSKKQLQSLIDDCISS
jgi:transcriptional regulator with XRE-family HTH domain